MTVRLSIVLTRNSFEGRGLGTGNVRSRHRGDGTAARDSNVKAWLYAILRNIWLTKYGNDDQAEISRN